jgi:hypothetical protein
MGWVPLALAVAVPVCPMHRAGITNGWFNDGGITMSYLTFDKRKQFPV